MGSSSGGIRPWPAGIARAGARALVRAGGGENDGPAFNAFQYSFFGGSEATDGQLEGGLEEGIEAPPAESLDQGDLYADGLDASYSFDERQPGADNGGLQPGPAGGLPEGPKLDWASLNSTPERPAPQQVGGVFSVEELEARLRAKRPQPASNSATSQQPPATYLRSPSPSHLPQPSGLSMFGAPEGVPTFDPPVVGSISPGLLPSEEPLHVAAAAISRPPEFMASSAGGPNAMLPYPMGYQQGHLQQLQQLQLQHQQQQQRQQLGPPLMPDLSHGWLPQTPPGQMAPHLGGRFREGQFAGIGQRQHFYGDPRVGSPHMGTSPLQGMHPEMLHKHFPSPPGQHHPVYGPREGTMGHQPRIGVEAMRASAHAATYEGFRPQGTGGFIPQGRTPAELSGLHSEPHRAYKCMTQTDISKILSIQAANISSGNPYMDDYYFQAVKKKRNEGFNRFAPSGVRDLGGSEQPGSSDVKFVQLEGLGRIPFSNLRTPRPLLDITAADDGEETKEGGNGGPAGQTATNTPLMQEPLLNARKVIEECQSLLLDVDDIDRLVDSDGVRGQGEELAQRRQALLAALVAAFRLPQSSSGAGQPGVSGDRKGSHPDGVFLRLSSLVKGRGLLARSFSTFLPPEPLSHQEASKGSITGERLGDAGLWMLYGALRNCRALFGPLAWITAQAITTDVEALTVATSKLASSLVQVISSLEKVEVLCSCMDALVEGDLRGPDTGVLNHEDMLLPLLPPNHSVGRAPVTWVEAVLVALLEKAVRLGLENDGGSGHNLKAWQESLSVLCSLVIAHLHIIVQVQQVAVEREEEQALEYTRGLFPGHLVPLLLRLCASKQGDRIKQLVGSMQKM
eukprot:evm.model.scf_1219EXC.2 EVM.evm.TU.scf_1219EXC.2   scf_1219EXC:12761-18077(-)